MMLLNHSFKHKLQQECLSLVIKKLELLNTAFAESREALSSEAKSTAGDKHETGRAMIQLEQEKMGRQLAEAQKIQTILSRINSDRACGTVQSGALVNTSMGIFYIAVGLGKVIVEDIEIFVMAPISPLAQAMLGKKAGQKFIFKGKSVEVKTIH